MNNNEVEGKNKTSVENILKVKVTEASKRHEFCSKTRHGT